MQEVRESGQKLTLLGDGRSDSQGHCAKFCTYSLVDADSGKVVAMEIVQVKSVINFGYEL